MFTEDKKENKYSMSKINHTRGVINNGILPKKLEV